MVRVFIKPCFAYLKELLPCQKLYVVGKVHKKYSLIYFQNRKAVKLSDIYTLSYTLPRGFCRRLHISESLLGRKFESDSMMNKNKERHKRLTNFRV